MFIIRLAAEALSLSEQNERKLVRTTVNGHTNDHADLVAGGPISDTTGNNKSPVVDGSTPAAPVVILSYDSKVKNQNMNPDRSDSVGLTSEVSNPNSPDIVSDRGRSSILYDLLSGRENLNTACHRSQLFLLSAKRQTNGHKGTSCNGMRRRKPLRPVKNVNTCYENNSDGESVQKQVTSKEHVQSDSSLLSFTQCSLTSSNSHKKLRGKKLNEQKLYRNRFYTTTNKTSKVDRWFRGHPLASGLHVKRKTKATSKAFKMNGGELQPEQPLDLSSPKSTGVPVEELRNRMRGPGESNSTKRFRKLFDDCRRRLDRPNRLDFENDSMLRCGENANRFLGKTASMHPVAPTVAPATNTSNSLPNPDGLNPLISDILNMLLNQSNCSALTYSGLNSLPTQEKIINLLDKPFNAQQPRVSHPREPPSTQVINPKPFAKSEEINRFFECYFQLTCPPRMRNTPATRKFDLYDKGDSCLLHPPEAAQSSEIINQHGRVVPIGTSFSHIHTHVPNADQKTLADPPLPPMQRVAHPLVERILTTLYGVMPTVRSGRISEPITSPSNLLDFGQDNAGPSSSSCLSSPPSKGTIRWCTSPIKKRPRTSAHLVEGLTKLRSDPILNYLVQFIKHPEALLIDCFNPILRGPSGNLENPCDQNAIVQRLGALTFQLLSRTEIDRIGLFQDTWHLLYVLCVLERGPDTWTAESTSLGSAFASEDSYSFQTKLDILSKIKRLSVQLNLSTQMYSLLRGLLLCHGKCGELNADTIDRLCELMPGLGSTEMSNSKHMLLKKLLNKLCSFHKDFVCGIFISPASSSYAAECYLINWIQLG